MGGRSISVLNVAEKPSVAKSVAAILSRNQGLRVREGRSRYNRIFEFNYSIRGQPCHMLFTSVTGHLMELEFEERYRKWHSCDPADLYHAPVRKFVPEVVDVHDSVAVLVMPSPHSSFTHWFSACFDFDNLFVANNLLSKFSLWFLLI